jgi:nitric oxide reductase subunit B
MSTRASDISSREIESQGGKSNLALILINKRYWWVHFLIVAGISFAGLLYLGRVTYTGAPPVVDFVSPTGQTVISADLINRGEEVFHLRGLMDWGTFMGDGAERGPDFTGDALHRTFLAMTSFYENELAERAGQAVTISETDRDAIAVRVQRDIRTNTYDEQAGRIQLNAAQISAISALNEHYTLMFNDPAYTDGWRGPTYSEGFPTPGYISDPDDLRALSAFFFWGGWVSAANRPGERYSYTHNWPYDPTVGNVPSSATVMWSFLSVFALWVGIMLVLYVYGQMKTLPGDPFGAHQGNGNGNGGVYAITTHDLEHEYVRPTQKATYKFFAFAMLVFAIQIVMGMISATDFVRPLGINLGDIVPYTVSRGFHAQLQIFWFFTCWVGYTIFFLPRLAKAPRGQLFLINLLFVMAVMVGAGVLLGVPAGVTSGMTGLLSDKWAYWFGSQGWEFMELGRFFFLLLLATFTLWIFIIYRGVKPWLNKKNLWSVPAWLLYGSGIMVAFLFFGLKVSPDLNFAISDYWRWMVVHMWVEVTFEVFTTVIVAYMLVQMGLTTRLMAERVIFLAVMMFLVTALIGISHNFYWIGKPTGIIALGSVFSTLQVLPLLLLTLDAWKMRREVNTANELRIQGKQKFVMDGVWLFILAVNFWNIFGAGVFGSLINLPIVNYFEHATFLTGNHAHAAMFGVKGNVAIAGLLYCCQHLFHRSAWNPALIRTIFWSLQIGVLLMMFIDLFPAGLYQMWIVLQDGLWAARMQSVSSGPVFVALTYARIPGGALFFLGGVLPLLWFVWSRGRRMNQTVVDVEDEWAVYQKGWAHQDDPAHGG